MPPDQQPTAETLEEIADTIAGTHTKRDGEWFSPPWLVRDAILSALRNERERACRLLCPFCGDDGYDLVWHHDEWRHYRKTDQHVQYCQATTLRGRPSGKDSES